MAKKESAKPKNPPLREHTSEESAAWVKGQHGLNFSSATPKQFIKHGLRTPGRIHRASERMKAIRTGEVAKSSTEWNSPERAKEVSEWQARRPKGGGRGVAAPHSQWVAWGSQNPNRNSLAARALATSRQWEDRT